MHDMHESMSEHDETTPVLIVGGSLVGLSMSLFLSWHGIPSLLVESHTGVSPHPRAFDFNMRTMETFRTVGAEDAIRQAEPAAYRNSGVLQAESLAGRELHWITQDATATENDLSPVPGSLVGQDLMEPILHARAAELGGDLRFHTEMISYEQDADGVSALIRDRTSGVERRIRARYLVAADGNRSAIRKQLGIEVQGHGLQGHQLSILFSADIQGALRERRIAICFVNNATLRGGTLILARGEGRGYGLYAHYHPEKGEQVEDFAGARGIEVVRAAIGIPDLPVEIVGVIPWEVAAWTAERFQQDNVFLVGDSAHVNPPTGAFGANTGIADAYNLAWKLAFVLKGEAGSGLLSTYTAERQPVDNFTVEQAFAWFARFASPAAAKLAVPALDYDTIAFGYRYPATPSSSQDQECYEDPHHPTGRPGTHAPHVVLQRQDAQISTFDLFGRHFVLLTGPDGQSWKDGARYAARQSGIVLDTYCIGDKGDLLDTDDRFFVAYGVGPSGAVLVRPDGFIAWRTESAHKDGGQILEIVLMQLLGRSVISTSNETAYTR